MVERPGDGEFGPFFGAYVSLVPEADVLAVLEGQAAVVRRLLATVPPRLETHRYGAGKWSVREVVGHMADAERVFGYRAFCIGRGEQAPLPGFDEEQYVAESGFDRQALAELVNELTNVREANLAALRRFDDRAWQRIGSANGTAVSARALAFIMAGHVRHHCGVLSSRYGIQTGV